MSESADQRTNGSVPERGQPQSPEEIREEIERTRADLAGTVDALHARLDLKSRARARAGQVKHRATTSSGRPRPEVLVGAAGVVLLVAGLVWWRRR